MSFKKGWLKVQTTFFRYRTFGSNYSKQLPTQNISCTSNVFRRQIRTSKNCENWKKVMSLLARQQIQLFQNSSQLSVDSNMSSCPSTPSTPTSPIDFDIKIVTKDDKERILEFLRTFFFKDEPLNSYLELITEENPRCLELEEYATECIDDGCSIIAVQNDKIIGVCLNGILKKGEEHEETDINHEKFSKIVKLLEFVEKDSDPFKNFPDCDKAITVKIISVDNTYRGKGIAKVLMAKAREIGKEKGCGFMTVDCSSHFTAMALKRLGFDLHYSKDYADYKVNGEVVFKPVAPHKAVTVYTQRIL